MPSGNSVAARVLQQLAQLTGDDEMQQALENSCIFWPDPWPDIRQGTATHY